MKNLVEINSNNIAEFIENFVDSGIKILDELDLFENDGLLASIPYGKIFHYATKKIIEINDSKEALRKSIALAHVVNLLNGIKKSSLPFKIDQDEFKENLNDVKSALKEIKVEIEIFNINKFHDNDIVRLYSEKIDLLFKNYFSEFQYNRIVKYRFDYLKYDFLKILDAKNIVFGKLISRINNKSFNENLSITYTFQYQEELKNYFNELVLNDSVGMTLADIYIEPEFRIHEYCLQKENVSESSRNKGFVSINKNSIHDFLYEIISGNHLNYNLSTHNSNLIFILGYPGQGKSSLCKKILYDIYELNKLFVKQTFYIKIRNIVDTVSLLNNPIQTLFDQWASENSSKDLRVEKKDLYDSLLILDGLDELFIKENLPDKAIDEFCRIMARETEDKPTLKVIITSRYGYINLQSIRKSHSIILQLKEFSEIQQLTWLSNYSDFHPETSLTKEKIILYNNDSAYAPIKELITQPILLHLIATLSQDVTSEMNRATIYNNLFTELIQRSWAKEGQIDILKGLTILDLRDFLRNIAYEIFRTGREYIHKSLLVNLPDTKSFINKLDYKDSIQDVLKNIMIAFYFQETQKEKDDSNEDEKNDYAIEFLHKSLQEYLVAEKIWERLLEFTDKDIRRSKYFLDSADASLDLINEILGEKEIPNEILLNLLDIIDNSDVTIKEEISVRFNDFLPEWIEFGLLKKFNYGVDDYYRKETALIRNLFHILTNLSTGKNYINKKIYKYLNRKTLTLSLKDQIFEGSYLGKDVLNNSTEEFFLDLYNVNFTVEDLRLSNSKKDIFKFDSMSIHASKIYQRHSRTFGFFNNCIIHNCELSLRLGQPKYTFTNCKIQSSKFNAGILHFDNCSFVKCTFNTLRFHKFTNCTFIECSFYFRIPSTTRNYNPFSECLLNECAIFTAKSNNINLEEGLSMVNCAVLVGVNTIRDNSEW